MNKNEYYGFDEDFEIYCASIYSDACKKKKAAEEAEIQKELHDDAVDLIIDKIVNFFNYFEDRGVMGYVDEAVAAKQIMLSLTEDGHVPPSLLLDAAYALVSKLNLRLDTKLLKTTKRRDIVTILIRYLEHGLFNKNPVVELECPLPNVHTVVEPNE